MKMNEQEVKEIVNRSISKFVDYGAMNEPIETIHVFYQSFPVRVQANGDNRQPLAVFDSREKYIRINPDAAEIANAPDRQTVEVRILAALFSTAVRQLMDLDKRREDRDPVLWQRAAMLEIYAVLYKIINHDAKCNQNAEEIEIPTPFSEVKRGKWTKPWEALGKAIIQDVEANAPGLDLLCARLGMGAEEVYEKLHKEKDAQSDPLEQLKKDFQRRLSGF